MSGCKYRPHRGGLEESMREAVLVEDFAALAKHLSATETDRVEVAPYGFDSRTGWDTHLVTVNGRPVGFTDGPIPRTDSAQPKEKA